MANRTVGVAEVFDASPTVSSYQKWVCFLCFLVVILDGFDAMGIGVAIPKIGEFLGAKMSALGVAMSASLFGSLIGAVIMGMLADRFGRKWMLVFCALIFGLFTILTATISNVGELVVYRFIAGLGLGGAIPNALATGNEYASSRLHKTFVTIATSGMPIGTALSGLVAAWCIPALGWRSIFYIGGIATLVVCVIVAFALPESLEFLVGRNKGDERIRKVVALVAPALASDKEVSFRPTQKKEAGVPVKNLFTNKRAAVTILFWIGLAAAYYINNILVAWVPTLLHKVGATVVQYSLTFFIANLGCGLALILMGNMMDKSKHPFRLLSGGFVLAFLSLIVFGYFAAVSVFAACLLAIICQIFIGPAQLGSLAVATTSYPADMRGTAVGWAYAVAKLGNVLAPLSGGYALSLGWSVQKILSTNSLVALFCAVMILIIGGRVATMTRWQQNQSLETAKAV